MLRCFGLLVVGLLTVIRPSQAQPVGWNKGLDALLDSIRGQWKIPGMAVAVVSKGKVVHLAGYGLRDVQRRLPVTPDTKFAIASISKSFTVTTLAVLAKQGKIEWDRQVRDYLPDFRVFDPMVTERMTIRDLVTMRSGLARHDLMWGIGVYSREDLYHRLRFLQPNRDFRTTWQYQNLMYTTAGYLAGRVNGTSWEELVRSAVLDPLGMANSGPAISGMQSADDVALPYALHDADTLMTVPWRSTDPIAPTGGLHSTAADLTRYLIMQMEGGTYQGREIITRADSRQMQMPQMAMQQPMTGLAAQFSELGDESYGMGFLVTSYRGRKLVHHPGNWDGYSLELSFLPHDSLGVVVLTNMYSTVVRDYLPWVIYDRLLGLPDAKWHSRVFELRDRIRAMFAAPRLREDSVRVPDTRPSRDLEAFVGTYRHPAYGDMVVRRAGDQLMLRFGNYEFPLLHYHYDVFRFTPPIGDPVHNRFRFRISFHSDPDGVLSSLSAPVEPSIAPLTFSRVR
ncbi:MAG: serine hydrolase [Gemmatimonadetes bacterium]|nr:serine hydrolase [Gemmatimonadota bacterium]